MAQRRWIFLVALLFSAPLWAGAPDTSSEPVRPQSAYCSGSQGSVDPSQDPSQPLTSALQEVSARLRATPYASSSNIAQQNTERFLSGLFAQSWDLANQLAQLDTPYFARSARIEGMPGLYNPDNVYRSALLEPDGVYRVYGQRGTHAELTFQVLDQYPIIGLGKNLMVVQPDQHGAKPGKRFEFFLGGQAPRGKTWFALPKNALAILARQSFADWQETPSTLFIERLDVPTEPEYKNQFAIAATALCQATKLWAETYVPMIARATKVNDLPAPRASEMGAGGLGGQQSILARYRVSKDEALLITVRKADAIYQGIQIGDPWFVTPNTLRHQISLTAKQAHLDEDGFIRFVIALEDPGVPNWLDAAGNAEGYVFMRWQGAKRPITGADAPSARLVPIASLRNNLPDNTPVVSAAERRAQLRQRKWVPQVR